MNALGGCTDAVVGGGADADCDIWYCVKALGWSEAVDGGAACCWCKG